MDYDRVSADERTRHQQHDAHTAWEREIDARCERAGEDLATDDPSDVQDWIANHKEGRMQDRLDLLVGAVAALCAANTRTRHGLERDVIRMAQSLADAMLESRCREIEREGGML
jgi:3-phenylpropionate/cinnamic acid dioxygenase small subunit